MRGCIHFIFHKQTLETKLISLNKWENWNITCSEINVMLSGKEKYSLMITAFVFKHKLIPSQKTKFHIPTKLIPSQKTKFYISTKNKKLSLNSVVFTVFLSGK